MRLKVYGFCSLLILLFSITGIKATENLSHQRSAEVRKKRDEINYSRGDLDLNGVIDEKDEKLLQNYIHTRSQGEKINFCCDILTNLNDDKNIDKEDLNIFSGFLTAVNKKTPERLKLSPGELLRCGITPRFAPILDRVAHIRFENRNYSHSVAKLRENDEVEILKNEDPWLYVKTSQGKKGWLNSEAVMTKPKLIMRLKDRIPAGVRPTEQCAARRS